MKIAIDAGHGLYTAGKRCAKQFDINETREWQLNSRIATKVCTKLNASGIETIRLDDVTGQTDIPLNTTTKNANNLNVDLVVSIHHNAGGGTGTETYVYNNTCLNGETGKIAKAINDKVVEKTGMKNRGVKLGDFAIIRDTKMKACLIECGFMDNANDTPIILTEEFAEKVATGIVEAICNYYNISMNNVNEPVQPTPQTTPTPAQPTGKIDVKYQVYAGKWYPNVTNLTDYAGVYGQAISGFRGNTVGAEENAGKLIYRVHTKNGKWLGEITDREKDSSGDDFAGILGKAIDGIVIRSTKGTARYRVHVKGGNWLGWITQYNINDGINGYAGIFGKEIDGVQVEII